jgi:PRTRC genetic system protein B
MVIPNNPLIPRHAIIHYYQNNGGYHNKESYLEKRDIRLNEKGEFQLGAGHPLTMSDLASIVEMVEIEKENEGLFTCGSGPLPRNLLFFDSSPDKKTLIWHKPSQLKSIYFSNNMNIPSGPVFTPNMLYVKKQNTLFVFSLKTKHPTIKSRIYFAPLYNISVGGSVCMGAALVKKGYSDVQSIMQAWEEAFWNSENSHFSHNAYEGKHNINLFWKDMVKTQKPFPNNILIPHSQFHNIEEIIRSFSR